MDLPTPYDSTPDDTDDSADEMVHDAEDSLATAHTQVDRAIENLRYAQEQLDKAGCKHRARVVGHQVGILQNFADVLYDQMRREPEPFVEGILGDVETDLFNLSTQLGALRYRQRVATPA